MVQRIHSFSTLLQERRAQHRYTIHVLGRLRHDGSWIGSLLFDPEDGSPPIETDQETTQPTRQDLEYWATGLEQAYLEGALKRAHWEPEPAAYTMPPKMFPRRTILNPYEVYWQGEEILRQELSALSIHHLRNIIDAYGLPAPAVGAPDEWDREALAESIVSAVRRRLRAA